MSVPRHVRVAAMAALVLVIIVAADGRGAFRAVPTEAASPYQMALDATAGGSVDATRNVVGAAPFSMGVNVTVVGATPYKGYFWEFEFPTSGLAFDGSVVENTAGTGLASCTGPNQNPGFVDPVNNTSEGGANCLSFGGGAGTSFVGQTTTFSMHCIGDGVWTVRMDSLNDDGISGSTLADATGAPLSTGTTGVVITCSGVGAGPTFTPTATPTITPTPTITNTPGPTNTPTITPTPCVTNCPTPPTGTPTLQNMFTRTPTPTPTGSAVPATEVPVGAGNATTTTGGPVNGGGVGGAGRPGGTIHLPDTGNRSTGSGPAAMWSWLLAGFLMVALGGTRVALRRGRK